MTDDQLREIRERDVSSRNILPGIVVVEDGVQAIEDRHTLLAADDELRAVKTALIRGCDQLKGERDEARRECDSKTESLDGLTDSLRDAREKIELLKALGHGLVDDTGDTLSLLVEAERQRDEAIKARSDLEIECGRLEAQRDAARAEVKRLQQWVNDLQSGMYINCVYCGHRYGPDPGTPVAMAEVLKRHIEQCPSHPLSHVKARLAKAEGVLRVIAEGHGQLATMASMARAYFAEQGAETQEETP